MNLRTFFFLVACLASPLSLRAADWPQWRGPDRNGVSLEKGLVQTWPKDGPKLLWSFDDAGIGFSGPAVAGDRLYTMGSDGKTESVYCLDLGATPPKKLWSSPVGPHFTNGYGDGPRCTPTVDGDRVFALGANGDLVCVETATGKKVWGKNLAKDLGGKMMSGWGYSESVLVDGGKVVCAPGGKNGTLAALDRKTGDVLWRSKDFTDPASYGSIIVAQVGDVRHYVVQTGNGAGGVGEDGRTLWTYRQNYNIAVACTPIFHDNHVYVSGDYGVGCDLIKLTPEGKSGLKAERAYSNREMQNHHGGVILFDGHVYGCSGNTNQRCSWVCQDIKSGKAAWKEGSFDAGSLVYADGHFYLYGQSDGGFAIIKASADGWQVDGSGQIPVRTKLPRKSGHIWTHPVVANGKLFLRDQDLLFCFDIKAR